MENSSGRLPGPESVESHGPFAGLGLTAALLLPGEAPSARRLQRLLPPPVRQQLYWLAADGGYHCAAKYQVTVAAVVGDMDSIGSVNPTNATATCATERAKIVQHSSDKDESDRNLALDYLWQNGHRRVLQIGGGGGRSDHFLAMIYDYWQSRRMKLLPCLWLTRCEAIFYLEPEQSLQLDFAHNSIMNSTTGNTAALLSTFPLSQRTRLHSAQLKWPLDAVRLSAADAADEPDFQPASSFSLPYSLSNSNNTNTGQTIKISASGGGALVFCPYAECAAEYAEAGQANDDWGHPALLRAQLCQQEMIQVGQDKVT